MLLIGSKALQFYIPDLGRVTHDWDLLCSEEEYADIKKRFGTKIVKETPSSTLFEVNDEVIEVKDTSRFDRTDHTLFLTKSNHVNQLATPFGDASVTGVAMLYDIKWATAKVLDEPKHLYDLELMEKFFAFDRKFETRFFQERLLETQLRVGNSRRVKKDFFHEYHIPEYIYHDELHEIIADLMDIKLPTYIRTIDSVVHRSQELFENLTHDQKISLMVEETLVLNLERWFIPQMVENGINYQLIEMFYNNNEGLPTYKILKHCNMTGLKGEAKWVTDFAKANFFEIEKKWQEAKAQIKSKGGFPAHFFNRLFKLREDFKQGKQVDKGQ